MTSQHVPPAAGAPFLPTAPPAAGLAIDQASALNAEARAKLLEKERFLREVCALLRQGIALATAVATVATRAEDYPLLCAGGKKGATALRLSNFRRWRRRLGTRPDGTPNWTNVALLADRYTTGARDRAGDPEFWQLVHRAYANRNRLSLANAYALAATAYRQAHPQALPDAVPLFHQVDYWFEHHADQQALALARLGPENFRNTLAGYILRDWSAIRPGEIWFGDHYQFDAPVKEWDESRQAWRPVRPWLTAWMDARSEYFPGFMVRTLPPNSLAIEDALLHGIMAAGNRPPLLLYIDNGRDYRSLGFTEPVIVDGHEHCIARELGCRVVNALPGNARAKVIERRFRDVAGSFCRYWAAWLGTRPGERPPAAVALWEKHPERLPSLHQFCDAFAKWLHGWYHRQESASRITGGRPPAELWAARPELRRSLGDRELFLAMLKPLPQLRTVAAGGLLRMDNRWYRSRALWPLIGGQVLVKADRWNAAHVYAFHLDGRLITEVPEALALPAIAVTAADKSLLADAMRENRQLLKQARNALLDATGTAQALPPAERFRLIAPDLPADWQPALLAGDALAASAEPAALPEVAFLTPERLAELMRRMAPREEAAHE